MGWVSGNYQVSQAFYLMGAMFDLEAQGWPSWSWGSPDVLAPWWYLHWGLWRLWQKYRAEHVSGVYLYQSGRVAKELRESRAEITSNPPFCDNVAQSEETQDSILWSGIA